MGAKVQALKHFTVDAKVNWRSEHWLIHAPEDVPVIAKTKFKGNVHVVSIVFSGGDVMPPYFFKKVETIMKGVYLQIQSTVVRSWM